MTCNPKNASGIPTAAILAPAVIVGTALLVVGLWLACNRRQIMQEIATFQVNRLKKRWVCSICRCNVRAQRLPSA